MDRSTFVRRAGYFLCFAFDLDSFGGFGFVLPFGTPDAPGNVAACCATNAELRRGFRVDVPASNVIFIGQHQILNRTKGGNKQTKQINNSIESYMV